MLSKWIKCPFSMHCYTIVEKKSLTNVVCFHFIPTFIASIIFIETPLYINVLILCSNDIHILFINRRYSEGQMVSRSKVIVAMAKWFQDLGHWRTVWCLETFSFQLHLCIINYTASLLLYMNYMFVHCNYNKIIKMPMFAWGCWHLVALCMPTFCNDDPSLK